MAGVAGEAGRDVIPRFGAGRDAMAGGAGTRDDTGMGEGRGGHHEGLKARMATVARGCGGRMSRGFAQRVPLGIRPVVTGAALSGGDTLRRGVCEA